MPYRIDLSDPPEYALDRLVDLGAMDIETVGGGIAALLPDGVTPQQVARALGTTAVRVTAARPRDDGSVWVLSPRPVRAGGISILPDSVAGHPGALRLADTVAFGTGLHPTTALCLDMLATLTAVDPPSRILDIGTGSGVLALASLLMGVERAVGIDIDRAATAAAAANARLNGLERRFQAVCCGLDAVAGAWPLVVANILAAPLIESAPQIVRRVSHRGQIVLSGIPSSVAPDVERAYRRLGMVAAGVDARGGWTVLVLAASW